MHVLIVGAGIAGLTAAIALRHKGIDATIIEQAPRLSEIGAGIQIASNGSVVLRELGLEQAVAAKSVIPKSFDMRDIRNGKLLYVSPLGEEGAQRWGAPLYNIHRADLIEILADALPSESVRLGVHCTGFTQDDNGVTVHVEDGDDLHGHVLIAADGIHSVIRKQLFGEDDVHFSNILMWRALIPAEKLEGIDLDERGNYWFGPGRTLITYWIRPKNLYSILASVPSGEVHRESWTESGDIEELRASFADLEPRAQAMMDQIDTAFLTGMFYRDPIDRWTDRRVTLMGDAAHPMVPFLAQGACQGIEDAWVLATMLEHYGEDNLETALEEYEQRRRPRTTRVQSGARAMVKLVHESEPERIKARNGRWKGMQHIDPMTEATWAFVWDYNVLEEVKRPAGEVQGLSATREDKKMERPESQRAFDMWKSAFTAEDVARGHDGMREGYDRFLTTHFPAPDDLSVENAELGGVGSAARARRRRHRRRPPHHRAALPRRRLHAGLRQGLGGVRRPAGQGGGRRLRHRGLPAGPGKPLPGGAGRRGGRLPGAGQQRRGPVADSAQRRKSSAWPPASPTYTHWVWKSPRACCCWKGSTGIRTTKRASGTNASRTRPARCPTCSTPPPTRRSPTT